jgi:hypothetical protein
MFRESQPTTNCAKHKLWHMRDSGDIILCPWTHYIKNQITNKTVLANRIFVDTVFQNCRMMLSKVFGLFRENDSSDVKVCNSLIFARWIIPLNASIFVKENSRNALAIAPCWIAFFLPLYSWQKSKHWNCTLGALTWRETNKT